MHERDILLATLEIVQPEERETFLAQVCGDDVQLRSRVDALLRAAQVQDSFLENPAVETEVQGCRSDTDRQEGAAGEESNLDFLQPSDEPGALGRLGNHDITRVIGRGGMGIVLEGRDTRLHRVVAVKVVAPQLAVSAAARQRFLREARAAAAVRDEHVVTIYAVDEADGLPYLVMEFIAGQSLHERIEKDGPLKLKEILRIGIQTARGLAAAHAHGLIHRDIKPANILLENGVERVKLTDFGLARVADEASITQSEFIAGTPQYMSPEQARGEALDYRTDLFSLGSVLYAMCTGRAPFRAANSMAVLKRVCEDTPSPIREANSEVPDWLVALVDKLHAKKPDDRYQSSAEVADILGQRLAELQHSTPLPPLATPKPATVRPSPRHWRLWAIAAAILLLLAATLGLAEGTGVTRIASTVIRLFTPEGTLVVEINDPAVKVTIEGDGGLVITGAGLHEVHLRPGSYKLQADKNGRPVTLERELVSISKGGREVVRVKLEGESGPAIAGGQKGAFVRLGGQGVEERKFDTLAEAVATASDGDTIEIRGNGLFVTEPITLRSALTIRAGEGFQPTLQLDPRSAENLLTAKGSLILEGIEFLHLPGNDAPVKWSSIVWATGDVLQVANCRFVRKGNVQGVCVRCETTTRAEFRNSQFTRLGGTSGNGINYHCPTVGTLLVENCVDSVHYPLVLSMDTKKVQQVTVHLRNNTLTSDGIQSILNGLSGPISESHPADAPRVNIESSQNVFALPKHFMIVDDVATTSPPPPKETLADACRRFLSWRDEGSLYPSQVVLGVEATQGTHVVVDGQAEWDRFWNLQPNVSKSGTPKFQGGDVLALNQTGTQALGPQAFRLREDSPGYRAGEGGKDLGADIDLVGPGAAYERWKKTPEYQQWLNDTAPVRTKAPQPAQGAFVLLGGKEVAERKFDTLTEAVQSASGGDTIEIRGNGPYLTRPIDLGQTWLTIRAGQGFRPVIKLSPEAVPQKGPLLATNAALVLEGLEFHRASWGGPLESGGRTAVAIHGAPLQAANCRFRAPVWADHSPACRFRNCEFLIADGVGGSGLHGPGARVAIENCIHWTRWGAIGSNYDDPAALHDISIRIEHSTFVGLYSFYVPLHGHLPETSEPIRLEVSKCVVDCSRALNFARGALDDKDAVPGRAEAEAMLTRRLQWQGERNVFATGSTSVRWGAGGSDQQPLGPESLEQWKQFWGSAESDSLEGQVWFQGGSLRSRTDADLDQLTPDDFRLRPDSAGYRAGKDGKDLGANIDLLGPGEAYERWKKTPEYQLWLKDTGQIRAESPKPETGAFVLLTREDVAERKFDTLAEAVLFANAGDTIEIRGNGPFVSEGVSIQHPLVISAGEGYTPAITLSQASADSGAPLLNISAPLVLEGLDLQRMSGKGWPFLLDARHRGSLHIANCRLLLKTDNPWEGRTFHATVRSLSLRNSILGGNDYGTSWMYASGSRCNIENCVSAFAGPGFSNAGLDIKDVAIRVRGNTLVGNCLILYWSPQDRNKGSLYSAEDLKEPVSTAQAGEATPPIRLELSGNVARWDAATHNKGILYFNQDQDLKEPVSADKLEAFLPRFVALNEKQNVYQTGTPMLRLSAEWQPLLGKRGQDLADWDRFWGQKNTGSVEGDIRFQGGDLVRRAQTAPEKLTAEDFRLRPDSAGYKAGKDGKDLGADIDLVGPGAAYERWKRTPEYQQWLNDTGQSVVRGPIDSQSYYELGNVLYAQKKPEEAARALSQGLELDDELKQLLAQDSKPAPTVETRRLIAYSAPRLLLVGNTDNYHGLCIRVLEVFGDTDDSDTAYVVARTCALAPDTVPDPSRLVQLAERAARAGPLPHYLHTLGLACYRADRFDEAIRHLDKSMAAKWNANAANWLVLAMAHQRLGKADEARNWYDKAVRWMDNLDLDSVHSLHGIDFLACLVLRREAETLLRQRPRPEPQEKAESVKQK